MDIAANLEQVRQQIQQISHANQRPDDAVRLLAVSKTKPLVDLQAAYDAGQRLFGENYVQEAVDKRIALQHLTEIEWHFIGPIQSNKSRLVAQHMDWVHTIDRAKIARRLSEQRPADLPPLNVCIQVNISGEASKSGILLSELDTIVALVQSLPNLTLRGLMAIPAPQVSEAQQRQVYRPLALAYQALSASSAQVDTLSIGMTDDMVAAIGSGSTMVRIGTALFGGRNTTASPAQP